MRLLTKNYFAPVHPVYQRVSPLQGRTDYCICQGLTPEILRPVRAKTPFVTIYSSYAANLKSISPWLNHFCCSLLRFKAVIDASCTEPPFDQLMPLCF